MSIYRPMHRTCLEEEELVLLLVLALLGGRGGGGCSLEPVVIFDGWWCSPVGILGPFRVQSD